MKRQIATDEVAKYIRHIANRGHVCSCVLALLVEPTFVGMKHSLTLSTALLAYS